MSHNPIAPPVAVDYSMINFATRYPDQLTLANTDSRKSTLHTQQWYSLSDPADPSS